MKIGSHELNITPPTHEVTYAELTALVFPHEYTIAVFVLNKHFHLVNLIRFLKESCEISWLFLYCFLLFHTG